MDRSQLPVIASSFHNAYIPLPWHQSFATAILPKLCVDSSSPLSSTASSTFLVLEHSCTSDESLFDTSHCSQTHHNTTPDAFSVAEWWRQNVLSDPIIPLESKWSHLNTVFSAIFDTPLPHHSQPIDSLPMVVSQCLQSLMVPSGHLHTTMKIVASKTGTSMRKLKEHGRKLMIVPLRITVIRWPQSILPCDAPSMTLVYPILLWTGRQ